MWLWMLLFSSSALASSPDLIAPDAMTKCIQNANINGRKPPDTTAREWLPADTRPSSLPRVAVVVGVPCHTDPANNTLLYPNADAFAMEEYLSRNDFSVIRMTGRVDGSEFEKAVRRATRAVAPDGVLLVYYSGHGKLHAVNRELRRYLVFSDTNAANPSSRGIHASRLEFALSQAPARHRVLILDSCFAGQPGAGTKSLGGGDRFSAAPSPVRLERGDIRLYASRYHESAIENVVAGAGMSVYTRHLVRALRDSSADRTGDGCVDLMEAHLAVQNRIVGEGDSHQIPQDQVFDAADVPLLNVACTRAAPTQAIVRSAGNGRDLTLLDREGTEVDCCPAVVEPGTYRLEVGEIIHGKQESTRRSVLKMRRKLGPGDWVEPDPEIHARRGTAFVDVGSTWQPAVHIAPPMGLSIRGWWLPRSASSRRFAFGSEAGVDLFGRDDLSDNSIGDAVCDNCVEPYHERAVGLRVGHWWTRPRYRRKGAYWGFGPSVGASANWRYYRDRVFTFAGYTAGIQGYIGAGLVFASLEPSATVYGEKLGIDNPRSELRFVPFVRISVGVHP